MGPVGVWCCFLLSFGTSTVGKEQVWNWHDGPKELHVSELKNVVKVLESLVAKVESKVKEGVVEVLPESVPHHVLSNDTAHAVDVGNLKNVTDPVAHDDGQNNTLNDSGSHENTTLNDSGMVNVTSTVADDWSVKHLVVSKWENGTLSDWTNSTQNDAGPVNETLADWTHTLINATK
ncbi:hypothetical protein NL108_017823 [Boleophthalmus pectinirostris]|nr:hypothetical protein NL108_017823 [Boleophthalmus pectinirostris]